MPQFTSIQIDCWFLISINKLLLCMCKTYEQISHTKNNYVLFLLRSIDMTCIMDISMWKRWTLIVEIWNSHVQKKVSHFIRPHFTKLHSYTLSQRMRIKSYLCRQFCHVLGNFDNKIPFCTLLIQVWFYDIPFLPSKHFDFIDFNIYLKRYEQKNSALFFVFLFIFKSHKNMSDEERKTFKSHIEFYPLFLVYVLFLCEHKELNRKTFTYTQENLWIFFFHW